jgi:formylglycine-generating enzyme required for sulfatase activity
MSPGSRFRSGWQARAGERKGKLFGPEKDRGTWRGRPSGERLEPREAELMTADGRLLLGASVLAVAAGMARAAPSAEPTAGEVRIHPKTGIELVYIPAGEFIMGVEHASPEFTRLRAEHGSDRDFMLAEHRTRTEAFWIAKCPVTKGQYYRFAGETGYTPAYHGEYAHDRPAEGRERLPVALLLLDDVRAFCTWAGLRLPTEAEWEKAARGTEGFLYPWGNEWTDISLPESLPRRRGPVGSYPQAASPYGVMDLCVGLEEWCAPNADDEELVAVLRGQSVVNPWYSLVPQRLPLDRQTMEFVGSPTGSFRVATTDTGSLVTPDAYEPPDPEPPPAPTAEEVKAVRERLRPLAVEELARIPRIRGLGPYLISPDGTKVANWIESGHWLWAAPNGIKITTLASGSWRILDIPFRKASPDCWSTDGCHIYTAGPRDDAGPSEIAIWRVDIRDDSMECVSPPGPHASSAVESPDGAHIAFLDTIDLLPEDDSEGLEDWVAIMAVNGTEMRKLHRGHHPAWSPDGTLIAFQRYVPDGPERGRALCLMQADGKHARRILTWPRVRERTHGQARHTFEPAWLPDNRTLVLDVSTHSNEYHTWLVDIEGQVLAEFEDILFLSGSLDGRKHLLRTDDEFWLISLSHEALQRRSVDGRK